MSPSDIRARGLSTGSLVKITTVGVTRPMESGDWSVVPYSIPKGCVATYFPEANHLIPIESYADESYTPTSKSVIVRVTV